MAILMEHPEHGRTHVYNNVEEERLAAFGWKRCDAAPKPDAEPPFTVEPAERVAPVVVQMKRRGRPPKARAA